MCVCVCAYARACVRACAQAWASACVLCACACACVCVCLCMCAHACVRTRAFFLPSLAFIYSFAAPADAYTYTRSTLIHWRTNTHKRTNSQAAQTTRRAHGTHCCGHWHKRHAVHYGSVHQKRIAGGEGGRAEAGRPHSTGVVLCSVWRDFCESFFTAGIHS